MKRAFVVLGPESSGTRIVTQAFISLGCFGNSGHRQTLDRMKLSNAKDDIVWRRSVPHGKHMPILEDLFKNILEHNYTLYPILVWRDKNCVMFSQLKRGLSTLSKGKMKVYKATNHIYSALINMKLLPYVINYEALVTHEEYRKMFFGQFGFSEPKISFYNANKKYVDKRFEVSEDFPLETELSMETNA